MTVVTPDRVETQIEAIDFWWRENRPAAPRLFVEELAACFDLLGCLPHVGRPYAHHEVRGLRRLLLRSTGYHVYYVVRGDVVIVVAVWNALRGAGPDLSRLPPYGGRPSG